MAMIDFSSKPQTPYFGDLQIGREPRVRGSSNLMYGMKAFCWNQSRFEIASASASKYLESESPGKLLGGGVMQSTL
jgi:hypothetical protein